MSIIRKSGVLILLLFCSLQSSSLLSQLDRSNSTDLTLVISDQTLGGNERYQTYLNTDKPVYREGESVFLRATILNAMDNTPLAQNSLEATIQIKGPKGNIVFDAISSGDDSVLGAQWLIPAGTSGGEYRAVVSRSSVGAPIAERRFDVRAYRAPRLKTQIKFARDGFGPGDEVQATVKVDRAEGGAAKGAKVSVVARVDGEQFYRKKGFNVPADGLLTVQFQLPTAIEIGDGSVSFIIEDGGVTETASKTLPIVLRDLDIDFYPEGGDLVAGLSSRVYLQARRHDGKPVDVKGQIVKMRETEVVGKAITSVETSHEGRGVFVITPEVGVRYALKLDQPSSLPQPFWLPSVKESGAVLQSTQQVYSFSDPINVELRSAGSQVPSKLTLHKRAKLIDSKTVSGDSNIELNGKDAEGVLIVTAWSANNTPLAERLIYREPKFKVNVAINMVSESYVPGDKVSLEVVTTNEAGTPVEAVVGLTVTDDAVLELIEKREQAPRLPAMVYLESEVQDLADAHLYFDHQSPDAPLALDLLLGTQGWRRFILVNYQRIKQAKPNLAARALAEKAPSLEPYPLQFDDLVRRKLKQEVLPRVEQPINAAPVVHNDELEEASVIASPALEEVIAFNQVEDFELGADLNAVKMGWFEPPQRIMVREYAHRVRANRKPNDRVDFTETVYWHKGIRTDARHGKATVSFDLSDSITSFRVMGDAFGRNGALGSSDQLFKSVEPFYIEPKMPLEVTVGDVIELPVAMVNASNQDIDSATIITSTDQQGLSITQAQSVSLASGERSRQVVRIQANRIGNFSVKFNAVAGPFADKVTRTLVVKPNGFPMRLSHAGLLSSDQDATVTFNIPKTVELGSFSSSAQIYPSPLANMEEALNALLREPHGCFEQTSSTNYPLVMAQQYFVSHSGIEPEKMAKAKGLLAQGYKKLLGFESKGNGYEWFGANPAHEALTAYGLMEFVDMAKVMEVDQAMIQRTRDWLMSRRDGKGGFKQNQKALDSFGRAPASTANAYIVWALLESGESPAKLSKEVTAVKQQAQDTDDTYIIALAANILHLTGDNIGATQLRQRLADAADKTGAVQAAASSITQSRGDSLLIETTSLAILAWLKDDERWAAQVEASMKWLFERSQSGRFGATQSTVLALKAINAYDAQRSEPNRAGQVQLMIDGAPFGRPVEFSNASRGVIELPDFSAKLSAGKHSVALRMVDGSEMPFSISTEFNTLLPISSKESPIKVVTSLPAKELREGEPVEMNLLVSVGVEDAPTPIAIIGIPAGLEVRHEQLKELVDAKRISSYEVMGRELVLYWRGLKASEVRNIPVSLTANIPGTFVGPASRSYLYYGDEHKHWVRGEKITIIANP